MKRWPLHKTWFWERAPFFRILVPLIAGILSYTLATLSKQKSFYPVLITLAAAFVLYIATVFAVKTNKAAAFAGFVLINVFILCSGWLLCYCNDIRNDNAWFGNHLNETNSYAVRITDAPSEKENTWKLNVSVLNSIHGNLATAQKGNAFLYTYKDDGMPFHKGDTVLVPANWQPIKNAGNPFEFDYAAYCARNNLYYQQFLSADDMTLYAKGNLWDLSFTDRVHDWCMAQLDTYITDSAAKGLVQSMLLGDEVNLDKDLLQAYAQTGIVHIIAISGSNVMIFFIIISSLLWWLKNKKHVWIKYVVALPLVWFYVMMAGAQPSAIRAAVMFSLLALSFVMQKSNNSLNQLFATATVLLCAQPVWLYSVGFQLSFVAVLSLVLFYRPVYNIAPATNKILKPIWATIAASMAAEILTAPLVIYYFHSFPVLFIITNVIAYFFMGLVLAGGMLVIGFSFVPVIAKALAWCTTCLVTCFDTMIFTIQHYNPKSFQFLLLSGIELLLLYAVIAGLALFILRKQKQGLFAALAFACLLLLSFCRNEWIYLGQTRLVVYNISKTNHVELIQGKRYGIAHTDTLFAADKKNYSLQPAHTGWQAWQKENMVNKEAIFIGGHKILLVNEPSHFYGAFPVDYLVINYAVKKKDLEKLQQVFSPKTMVLNNNFSRKQLEKYATLCAGLHINLHTIANDGPFIVNGF